MRRIWGTRFPASWQYCHEYSPEQLRLGACGWARLGSYAMKMHPHADVRSREMRTRAHAPSIVGHLNQHVAAAVLRIDQPRVSDLLHGQLERFSASKLIRILANIDRRVDITVVNEGPEVLRWFKLIQSASAKRKAP